MPDTPKPGTPLPWYQFDEFKVLQEGKRGWLVATTEEGEFVSEVCQENAAYIVHACNRLPELEAKQDALEAERDKLRELISDFYVKHAIHSDGISHYICGAMDEHFSDCELAAALNTGEKHGHS